MCFSASVSFTASAVLLLCGIAALKKAKKKQLMFAATPLLFSAQQFIEGLVWQALGSGADPSMGTYGFLFFVFLVWPLWPSLSLREAASKVAEKKRLLMPLFAGIIVVGLTIYYATQATPSAVMMCGHIRYSAPLPHGLWLPGTILYLIATIMPFFIVQIPHLWIMGVLLALAYLGTFLFYFATLTSAWCFFAAVLSTLIVMIVG